MKVRALAAAVFRSVASSNSSGQEPLCVSDVIAEVSINSPDGALVDREKLDGAVTLLLRANLIEPERDGLRFTAEGDHFWRRISRLPPSGMKKWIREALDAYSRGEELEWTTSEKAWSDAQVLFLDLQRSRMVARLEVLDGLLGALENWHFVSTLVGLAADRSAAVAALQAPPLLFSKIQAQQVLDMGLSHRTALGRLSLAEERDAIRAELDRQSDEEPPDRPECVPTAELVALRQHISSITRAG